MELIAAIDLLGGRARRLVQGDYARPVEASADPLELAGRLLAGGVRRLHVVDLDGARLGQQVNIEIIGSICALAAGSNKVQSGGGLRDEPAVERLLEAGVDEAILGSAAIAEPAFLGRCAARWPGRVGVALDLRDGRPAVAGWTSELDAAPFELAERLLGEGASRLQVTDVSRDGTGAGPNLALIGEFRSRFPDAILVAAAGVATAADLAALARTGVDGAIVGRALLDGSLDVAEALAACAPAASDVSA